VLIEFRVANFRSFRDAQAFSMVGGNFADHIQTHTFDSGAKGFDRLLKSAAIYGANASGKTNLLLAIQCMQQMVLGSASAATGPYPYNPFRFSKTSRDAVSKFEVTFVQGGTRYEYGFEMGHERIHKEWLVEHVHARGRELYERVYDAKKKRYEWRFSSYLKGNRTVWSEATRPNALFLSTAIQLNSQTLLPVFEWFQKRLVIIVGPANFNVSLTLKLLDQPDGKRKLLPFLQEADLGIVDLEMKRERIPSGAAVLSPPTIIEQTPAGANQIKVTLSHRSDDKNAADLDLSEESSGTRVLFGSAGAWLNVFANGEVLLLDEIDTSLHPLLTRYLVEKFHSKETNPRNAQLVFTTHDVSLLRDLFRRDQVWFVEKERDGASKLYPLTDFKPRNDEALERGYIRGRYGALPILSLPST
jgi:hypothetical protein